MKKIFIFVMGIIGIVSLAGCGHNVVVYSDGIGLETTLNPETCTAGLNFRYGKILTATIKEKTEVNLEDGMLQQSAAGESLDSKTGLETKLYIKTGDQVTGYTVELEKIKSEIEKSKKAK